MSAANSQLASRRFDDFIDVVTALATERDVQRLYDVIVRSGRRLTGARAGRLFILDSTKRHLNLANCQNERPRTSAAPIIQLPLFTGDKPNNSEICSYAAFCGKLVSVDNIYEYSGFDFSELYRYDESYGVKTRSVLALPLRNHEEVTIGVLQLMNYRDPLTERVAAFPHEMEDLVNAFGSHAAIALNNVQLIEENKRLIDILDHTNKVLEEENEALRAKIESPYRFSNIVGKSASMSRVFELMDKVLNTDATVLVNGETGTGKELIARAIHYNSRRKRAEFVAQNCAALPEGLLESELFGYRKGAFSGADTDKKGLIELADGGTLFLDEIGDMPIGLQAKLLRFLQENEVRPLGALESKKVNVRIVAATHCDLQEKIAKGEFREDLYYRLCVFPLELPPLRERKDDLPGLLEHFLEECGRRYDKVVKGISPSAMNYLLQYDYPGNIRELRNIVERAVLISDDGAILLPEHLPDAVTGRRMLAPSAGASLLDIDDLKDAVAQYETALIRKKLNELDWNQTKAARELNISRRTLIEKMQKYDIQKGGHFDRFPAEQL